MNTMRFLSPSRLQSDHALSMQKRRMSQRTDGASDGCMRLIAAINPIVITVLPEKGLNMSSFASNFAHAQVRLLARPRSDFRVSCKH